jgi:hypothetical protein
MTPQQPDELDRRIRESYRIEPAAIRRVVEAARAASDARPRRAWALRVAVAATAGVLALSAAVLWWPRDPITPAPAEAVVLGSLTDGVLVLTWPDGSTSILGPDRSDERPPDGVGIFLVEGGNR